VNEWVRAGASAIAPSDRAELHRSEDPSRVTEMPSLPWAEASCDNRPVPDDLRIHASVHGRVQNVGFRWFVLDRANDLGLRGTVANRPDGTVECVIEGPRPAIDRMLEHLHRGPRSARVERVEVDEQPARGDLPPMRMTA
jgi:acylphosphatase